MESTKMSNPDQNTNMSSATAGQQSATVVAIGFPSPHLQIDTGLPHGLRVVLENSTGDDNRTDSMDVDSGTAGEGVTDGHDKPSENLGLTPNLVWNNLQNRFNFGGGGPLGPGGPGGDSSSDKVDPSFKLEALGGLKEQIEYLQRAIILPIVKKDVLKSWGVEPPKGILFHGPPGTGKTFLAKAIVNELKKQLDHKVSFFYRKGGDVFSMWFGESQRKLREVFSIAKARSPSVLFFDEIDGLCPSRELSRNHGTSAYASIVTCFLGQMDAIENGQVFVIAATNRLEAVDPAVRRPGRFDKHLSFNFPDEAGRKKILQIHTGKWPKKDQLDPNSPISAAISKATAGFSGADIEKLCHDVAYSAIESQETSTDNYKITQDTWMRAISQMQKTASNSFGSNLFTPAKPTEIVLKLIGGILDEVNGKLEPYFSSIPEGLPGLTAKRSILLYITSLQSRNFMNNQILQGILTGALFDKTSIFSLSLTSILSKMSEGQQTSLMGVMNSIMKQAEDIGISGKRCCVVVQTLNEILDYAKAKKIPVECIFSSLKRVRGPNMILIGTTAVPPERMDLGILDVFDEKENHIMLRSPSKTELDDLLTNVFNDKKGGSKLQSDIWDGIYGDVVKKCINDTSKFAEGHDFDLTINLISDLDQVEFPDATTSDRMDVFRDRGSDDSESFNEIETMDVDARPIKGQAQLVQMEFENILSDYRTKGSFYRDAP